MVLNAYYVGIPISHINNKKIHRVLQLYKY